VLSGSSRSPPSFVNSNSWIRHSVSFNGRLCSRSLPPPLARGC